MIVLDASAAVEWLLRTPRGRLVDAHVAADPLLAAPHLIDAEVAAVLHRAALAGALSEPRALQALDDWAVAPIHRYPHPPMLAQVWRQRHNTSAYDAFYAVLAQTLDATLLTGDQRLARALAGTTRLQVV